MRRCWVVAALALVLAGCAWLPGGARQDRQAAAIAALLERVERLTSDPDRPVGHTPEDPVCAVLSRWAALTGELDELPEPSRLRDEGLTHGFGGDLREATCGFAAFEWEDEGETLTTSAVLVVLRAGGFTLDDAPEVRTPGGRRVHMTSTNLGALTIFGHGRGDLGMTLAVVDAGSHSLAVAVHDDLVEVADPAALVDAAWEDLDLP